jgi:hypothetical protein
MAKGNSGRIVLEVDPELKKALYSELAKDGLTLKGWFVRVATNFIAARSDKQMAFDFVGKSEKNGVT